MIATRRVFQSVYDFTIELQFSVGEPEYRYHCLHDVARDTIQAFAASSNGRELKRAYVIYQGQVLDFWADGEFQSLQK